MIDEPFEIRFISSAQRDFDKLPPSIQNRVLQKLDQLADNPFGSQSEKLSDRDNSYRIRVGDYRILYRMDVFENIIWVVRIAHRREVYR